MSEMRAVGIDIHPEYQRGWKYQKNIDYIMVQLTNGIVEQNYLDEVWDEVMACKDDGGAVVGYHYMRSGWSAPAQLDAFFTVAERLGNIDGFMLDGETKGNVKGQAMAYRTKKVLDGMLEEGPAVLYAGRYWIQDWLYPWTKFLVEDPEKYPLMIAQYPYKKWTIPANEQMMELDGGWEPVLPAGRTQWTHWQFSAGGNLQGPKYGLPNPWYITTPSIDLSVFNGTVQELKKFWRLDIPAPPELPTPVNCEEEIRSAKLEELSAVRVWAENRIQSL